LHTHPHPLLLLYSEPKWLFSCSIALLNDHGK
jgi:hypothetical protein